MTLSSLSNPIDLARAQAALEAAWDEIRSTIPEAVHERERTRVAYIVTAFVAVSEDADDLKKRVIERYRQPFVA